MLKEAAIESLAASLLEEDEIADASAAVDLAQLAINLIDECNRENVFPEDILGIAELHHPHAPTVMNALIEMGYNERVAVGAGVVACLFLIECSKYGLNSDRQAALLESAAEHLAVEGWMG